LNSDRELTAEKFKVLLLEAATKFIDKLDKNAKRKVLFNIRNRALPSASLTLSLKLQRRRMAVDCGWYSPT